MPDLPENPRGRTILQWWADKVRSVSALDTIVALIATSPFAYRGFLGITRGNLSFSKVALVINLALFAVSMVVRRLRPVRVATAPSYWLLAFLATYWYVTADIAGLVGVGTRLVPAPVTMGISVLSLALRSYATLSLGRNMGLVPAQRELVTSGAYGVVRHPLYTSAVMSKLSLGLEHFSIGNIVVLVVGTAWFVVKTFMEERFLLQDAAYAAYAKKVRWRWLPFAL